MNRRPTLRTSVLIIALIVCACGIGIAGAAAPAIDEKFNTVTGKAISVSDHARKLHRTLLIVDLHADSLLWDRNLLVRNRRGHVDIPRLIEGNVAIQAFTIVSKVPRRIGKGQSVDQIGLLAVAERWPPVTWTSLKERVIYQTRKLEEFAQHSNGQFTLIKTCDDLNAYLRRRQKDSSLTAGFLGVEGAHALEGDLMNVDVFFDHGIRMMSPSHFFDNDIGGSSHGKARTGLTNLGRDMIRKMQTKSMIVDLAHASGATIRDTLAISRKPVVVSHTGVKGTCDSARNLSDAEIIGVARTGGVIGIGYWTEAVCGRDAHAIARAIRYAVNVAGIEHVALGSDFDGACSVPFDASGLISLTQALIDQHFTDEEIRKIMGDNALRVLRSGLPAAVSPTPQTDSLR